MVNRQTNLPPAASPWPHRLAWALACTTFPLIWLGGLVTTYEAGMAVPDWPTTYQYWFYPLALWVKAWDLFLEHGHRTLAQLVGLLAIALAIALWRKDRRKWTRWLAVAAVAGVVLQGTLGGLRVLMDARVLARIHGCTAPLYFGLCVGMVCVTSRAWREQERRPQAASRRAKRLALAVTAALYLEIVLGALLRHPAAEGGWFAPDLLVWAKLILAGLIVAGVAWLWIDASRHLGGQPMIVRRARLLGVLFLVQLVLAAATWVTNYGWPRWFSDYFWTIQYTVTAMGRLQVTVTTAHAAVGSLALAAALSLALWSSRLTRGVTP